MRVRDLRPGKILRQLVSGFQLIIVPNVDALGRSPPGEIVTRLSDERQALSRDSLVVRKPCRYEQHVDEPSDKRRSGGLGQGKSVGIATVSSLVSKIWNLESGRVFFSLASIRRQARLIWLRARPWFDASTDR